MRDVDGLGKTQAGVGETRRDAARTSENFSRTLRTPDGKLVTHQPNRTGARNP